MHIVSLLSSGTMINYLSGGNSICVDPLFIEWTEELIIREGVFRSTISPGKWEIKRP